MMKITVPLLVGITAPLKADAWSFGLPRYGLTLLEGIPDLDAPVSRMIREQEELLDRAFGRTRGLSLRGAERSSSSMIQSVKPQYEIINDDKHFKVAIDAPGVKADDISVNLNNEDKILTISGSRESKGEGYMFSSKFSQSFSLDPSVQVNKLAASLEDGVLVVSAPKDATLMESKVRSIPVMAAGKTESTDGSHLNNVEGNKVDIDVKHSEPKNGAVEAQEAQTAAS